MSEYRQTSVVGTSYQRGRTMSFENPRSGVPSITIQEERVTILADRVVSEPAGMIVKPVADLSVVFPLINPATNEAVEGQTMSYQDVYVALYSLYWHLATERDAAALAAAQAGPRGPRGRTS